MQSHSVSSESKVVENSHISAFPNDEFCQSYLDLDNTLRHEIDAQYDIKRTIVIDQKLYPPTGIAVIRDTTHAKEVLDPDTTLFIEGNNTLLRSLARLRGIDFALKQKMKEISEQLTTTEKIEEYKTYLEQRIQLQDLMTEFIKNIRTVTGDGAPANPPDENMTALNALEKVFNTELCKVLHVTNLAEGCHSAKAYKKLLFNYKNLSSLIEPTKALVTVCYDEKNDVEHRITQYPVTVKTQKQKASLEKLKQITIFPAENERNAQSVQSIALQKANRLYADLLMDDKRMLPAQTRKTHAITAKNAFIVKNELTFKNNKDPYINPIKKTNIYVRSASPVYVGKEISEAEVQAEAENIIQQVKQVAALFTKNKNPQIHFNCLLTNSRQEKQNYILHHLRRLRDARQLLLSNIPVNLLGFAYELRVAKEIARLNEQLLFLNKKTKFNRIVRHQIAALISAIVQKNPNFLNVIGCASGQDRTGTLSTLIDNNWVTACYEELGKNSELIESLRAKMRNTAEIATHLIPGSRGCKNVSCVTDLFSKETEQATYLASANTNKQNRIDKDKVVHLTKQNCKIADDKLNAALHELKTASNIGFRKYQTDLQNKGEGFYRKAILIKATLPAHEIGLFTRIVKHTTLMVKGPQPNLTAYRKNTIRYANMMKQLAKNKISVPLKSVAKAMLSVGTIALIVAGILAAAPTGGSSIVASLIATKALITYSSVAASGVGMRFYQHKTEKESAPLVNEMRKFF